jgi:ribosomal protein S18 acetylase RimI-like enzyme
MNDQVSLQPASREDKDILWRVFASVRGEEIENLGWPAQQLETFLRMQFNARCSSYATAYPTAQDSIVLKSGSPIGTMTVSRTASEIRLVDIALLREHRNSGFGSQMLSDLIREARASHVPLRLSVMRQNRAQNLYRRLGFVPTSEDAMYIEMEYQEDRPGVQSFE